MGDWEGWKLTRVPDFTAATSNPPASPRCRPSLTSTIVYLYKKVLIGDTISGNPHLFLRLHVEIGRTEVPETVNRSKKASSRAGACLYVNQQKKFKFNIANNSCSTLSSVKSLS